MESTFRLYPVSFAMRRRFSSPKTEAPTCSNYFLPCPRRFHQTSSSAEMGHLLQWRSHLGLYRARPAKPAKQKKPTANPSPAAQPPFGALPRLPHSGFFRDTFSAWIVGKFVYMYQSVGLAKASPQCTLRALFPDNCWAFLRDYRVSDHKVCHCAEGRMG